MFVPNPVPGKSIFSQIVQLLQELCASWSNCWWCNHPQDIFTQFPSLWGNLDVPSFQTVWLKNNFIILNFFWPTHQLHTHTSPLVSRFYDLIGIKANLNPKFSMRFYLNLQSSHPPPPTRSCMWNHSKYILILWHSRVTSKCLHLKHQSSSSSSFSFPHLNPPERHSDVMALIWIKKSWINLHLKLQLSYPHRHLNLLSFKPHTVFGTCVTWALTFSSSFNSFQSLELCKERLWIFLKFFSLSLSRSHRAEDDLHNENADH